MAARPPLKKVRLACQRCRHRRTKCDGQLPACSSCAKAGQPCIGVNGEDAGLQIPRNFVASSRERIRWLEGIITLRLPDVDLRSGPQVGGTSETVASPQTSSALDNSDQQSIPSISRNRRQSAISANDFAAHRTSPGSPVIEQERPFAEQAYSVANSLGMITLNSDSSQKHYLGASSGALFTNLIGVSPPNTQSPSGASQDSHDATWDGDPTVAMRSLSDRQKCQAMQLRLRQELPSRDEAMTLAHVFIQSMYPEFPVIEPDSLLTAIDALYSCASSPLEQEDFFNGWPASTADFKWNTKQVQVGLDTPNIPPMASIAFIVFMAFNIAAIVKIRRRAYNFHPEKYYKAAMLFAPDCFSQINLVSIQALVVLIIHCIHTPAEANIWTLIHIGMAYCVELGLHLEDSGGDFDLCALKRLIFYTLYSLDRSIASIQGRPLGLRDECIDVKLPDIPQVTVVDGEPSVPWMSAGILRFVHHNFELQTIVSSIKTQLYQRPDRSYQFSAPPDPLAIQSTIRSSLQTWWDSVFADDFDLRGVDVRFTRVWRVKLRIRFYTALILLYQPSPAINRPSHDSLQIVFDSATFIIHDFQLQHDNSSLDFGWRNVQNTFASGAALIYSFWTSRTVQERTNTVALSRTLRTCMSLLTIGGEWWPSAKASLSGFGSIIDLTIQKSHYNASISKPSRPLVQQQNGYVPGGGEWSSAEALPATQGWASGTEDNGVPTDPAGLGEAVNPWQGAMPQIEAGGVAPESVPLIEHFLADFDQSVFTWTIPMNDSERQLDLGPLM